MTSASEPLTLKQIRQAFRRNHGAAANLARDIGVSQVSIALWLKGTFTSRKIARAARRQALRLLDQEARNGQ